MRCFMLWSRWPAASSRPQAVGHKEVGRHKGVGRRQSTTKGSTASGRPQAEYQEAGRLASPVLGRSDISGSRWPTRAPSTGTIHNTEDNEYNGYLRVHSGWGSVCTCSRSTNFFFEMAAVKDVDTSSGDNPLLGK